MEKYEKVEKVGEGTYGVVYAHTAQDGQPRALKRLKPSRKPHRGVPLAAYREIRALSALKHDNLLRLCAPPRLDAADRSLVLHLAEAIHPRCIADHLDYVAAAERAAGASEHWVAAS